MGTHCDKAAGRVEAESPCNVVILTKKMAANPDFPLNGLFLIFDSKGWFFGI